MIGWFGRIVDRYRQCRRYGRTVEASLWQAMKVPL